MCIRDSGGHVRARGEDVPLAAGLGVALQQHPLPLVGDLEHQGAVVRVVIRRRRAEHLHLGRAQGELVARLGHLGVQPLLVDGVEHPLEALGLSLIHI